MVGLLLGFALRVYHLGAESLWYDETVSVYLARQSIPDLIAHTARDIHPPGYYLLLHLWQGLTQPSLIHGLEFLYAWPSLVAGILLLPLIYALGRKIFDPSLALLALWLTAVHPFHLWYSQEVRMYTLAAALGMICWWAALKWISLTTDRRPQTKSALFLYVIAAAAGLYTLYYFAFLLIALNLWIAGSVISYRLSVPNPQSPIPNPLSWIVAQLAVIVLWLPWLPTFWRQMTEPPVPPWRGDVDGLTVLRETLSAALVGQTPPMHMHLLWAGLGGILLIATLLSYANTAQRRSISMLLVYIFAPLLLIYTISLWITSLYHIRYFFTYAAPLPLLLALGLRTLTNHRRPLLASGVALLFAISAWSLAEFWTDPLYRADDHRAAVADLAAAWRPGDAILVNAGWVYPTLEIYWPQSVDSADASLPFSLTQRTRLLDYANPGLLGPVLVTTGSVDGSPTLGWGLAESDFYRMDQTDARAALTRLIRDHPRVWHYRLYDTVSDPAGDLRAQLAEQATLIWDQPYQGRDYLRVQLYETSAADEDQHCPRSGGGVDFGKALHLSGVERAETVTAGSFLYATLCWGALPGVAAFPDGLRMSLRLYRHAPHEEMLLAQADSAPLCSTATWQAGNRYRQPLALPISIALPPGSYDLALIVYNGTDGTPLPPNDPAAVEGQRWPLGQVDVTLPPSPPRLSDARARFDYIDLLSATVSATASPGGILTVETIWQPQPNAYRDSYRVVYILSGGEVSQRWQSDLGGAGYPSGSWPAGYPVQQKDRLELAADLPPGDYQLSVQLERASDGLPIPAQRGFLNWGAPEHYPLGVIVIR